MFGFLKNKAVNLALATLKERIMEEYLEGIGIINELIWKDGALHVKLTLNGLEDRPVEVTAREIEIAPDGSSITIHSWGSNMTFAEVALNRYATRSFAITDGKMQSVAQVVHKTLAA